MAAMRGGARGGEAHVGSARGRAAMAGDGAGYAGRWPRARLGAATAAQAAAVAHASGARA